MVAYVKILAVLMAGFQKHTVHYLVKAFPVTFVQPKTKKKKLFSDSVLVPGNDGYFMKETDNTQKESCSSVHYCIHRMVKTRAEREVRGCGLT